LDIRKRTGVLFGVVMVAQVILVSAQVQSRSGVRVLSLVTFEVFSRVERAAFGVINGTRNLWGNYVGLRGTRAENEALRRQVADLEIQLQAQRALAARYNGGNHRGLPCLTAASFLVLPPRSVPHLSSRPCSPPTAKRRG